MTQPETKADGFHRYTDRAEAVIASAHYHAQRLRRDRIDTEHLLLGITDAGEGVASMALAALHISLDTVREAATRQVPPGQAAPGKTLAFTQAAAVVLDRARYEADTLGHDRVGTEHLLLGLLGESDTTASQVLEALGITDDQLYTAIRHLLSCYVQREPGAQEPDVEQVFAGRRLALPAQLGDDNQQIADTRRLKEAAIEAQDFATAATLRTTEKQLLTAKIDRIKAWAAHVGVVALVDEIDRLYREADRLRERLRQREIDPTEL